jgi:hypothetical protein
MTNETKTPRTDEQELAYVGEDGSRYVHSDFARQLETELTALREKFTANEHLLHEAMQGAELVNAEFKELRDQLAAQRMNKERLDWLARNPPRWNDYKTQVVVAFGIPVRLFVEPLKPLDAERTKGEGA